MIRHLWMCARGQSNANVNESSI